MNWLEHIWSQQPPMKNRMESVEAFRQLKKQINGARKESNQYVAEPNWYRRTGTAPNNSHQTQGV